MRMTYLKMLVMSIVLVALGAVVGAPSLAAAEGQIGAAIEIVPIEASTDQFLMTQKTVDGTLILTPNEVFFPKRGLKAGGQSNIADVDELNKGMSFAEIQGWDKHDIAEWGVWFPQQGEVEVRLAAAGGGQFTVKLGGQAKMVTPGKETRFVLTQPGQHSLKLLCEQSSRDATVQRIVLTGRAAKDASVIRKRWRPAAAHTKFRSSADPKSVRLWVMEMDAVPGDLGFYSPMTTPFGYYGPTWNADGTVNTSFNFSLWSFRRNQPEPPIEQLSHLIAIGNPNASFGGFGHEGTGVKVRDWEPLAGRQGQRQAIALRVEPGDTYDTYHSYFYASDEKRWRLFGSGKKLNKGKPLDSLWVGSFVEVPGAPAVQRTGAYARIMRYRGWAMDGNEKWYRLDRMANGNIDRKSGLTHTDRGATDDGWFFLETGGWTLRKPPANGAEIALPPSSMKENVEYMSPAKLLALKSVPCNITITDVKRDNAATLEFRVRAAARSSEVTVYWGNKEALTFAERWQHSTRVKNVVDGVNRVALPSTKSKGPLFLRLLLKNEEGQFWSRETFVSP